MKHFFFFTFLLLGCGPNAIDDVIDVDGGLFLDATVPRDASLGDSALDAPVDATTFNGGGPFLCTGCVCDGTIDMCYFAGGGGAPIVGDAGDDPDASPFGDASACAADSGPSQCTQIPIQCLPHPTCACLEQTTLCACSVDPSGSGFVVTCPPKP